MNQLEVEALEDEIEHHKRLAEALEYQARQATLLVKGFLKETPKLRQELRDIRENVMVALEELRSLPGAEAAAWRLRRCLVKELNANDAGTEAPASPELLRNLETELADHVQ